MNSFLLKSGIAIFIVFTAHLVAGFLADGTSNNFYLRFTTPSQSSLILGTSRAAQGIYPQPLDSILTGEGFELPIFNFGFTIAHSPYGSTYLRAIKKKVTPGSKSGLFLVTVSPWSVSNEKSNPNFYEESDRFLAKMNSFNAKPNFEFLMRFYSGAWGKLISSKFKNSVTELTEDGRLDITISMEPEKLERRTKRKIRMYREDVALRKEFSELRWSYLVETVEYLQKHGKVFFIRLPVDPKLAQIETDYMPDFDDKIEKLASEKEISYLNYIDKGANYVYTDGNHLYRDSGAKLSKEIALKIKSLSN